MMSSSLIDHLDRREKKLLECIYKLEKHAKQDEAEAKKF